MKPYQERVVIEKSELDEKLSKLNAFFNTGAFTELDSAEQVRLNRQRDYMTSYSQVLGERIEAFKGGE